MSVETFNMSQADARELLEDIILRNDANEASLYPNERDCFNFHIYRHILDIKENKRYEKLTPNFNENQMKYFCTQHEKNVKMFKKFVTKPNNTLSDSDSDSDSDGACYCKDGCDCE